MAQQGATVTYSEGGFLDRFPWYVQLGVLLVSILVVVFAVDYFVMKGWRDDADVKDQQAQELRRQNQEAEIIRQNIEAYTKTLEGLNAQLDTLKVRLPEQREVTNIFDQTKSQMLASGLKLVQFSTNDKTKEVDKTYYTEVPSQVRVVGSYPKIQEFFQRLAGFDRIVNVTDITLQKADDKDQAAGATTSAGFNLTAFYISDANRTNLESQGQPTDPKNPNKAAAPGTPGAPPAAPPAAPK
jgi:type IV pilus assembly protein PilO